jgi:hypothetical protein
MAMMMMIIKLSGYTFPPEAVTTPPTITATTAEPCMDHVVPGITCTADVCQQIYASFICAKSCGLCRRFFCFVRTTLFINIPIIIHVVLENILRS